MTSTDSFAVWNRAQAWVAWVALETLDSAGTEKRDLARRRFLTFDAECKAMGLGRDALFAAEECLRLRDKIMAGDGGAVLDAIGYCAAHSLVIPPWLADEYLRRHGAVARGRAKDWSGDRAFGRPYPKGTNIAGIRARAEDATAAYVFASNLLAANPARPFDAEFYEEVGAHIGVGKTRAYELLAMATEAEGYSRPPLADLREKLAAGVTKDEAFRELANERYDAWLKDEGYSPDSSGVWRKSDPGK